MLCKVSVHLDEEEAIVTLELKESKRKGQIMITDLLG